MNLNNPVPESLLGLSAEEAELAKLERTIQARKAQLEEARKELTANSPAKNLAILLHDKLCRWNHTDGCGWHYDVNKGIHNWNGHDHKEYLLKAELVLAGLDREPVTTENIERFITKLFS